MNSKKCITFLKIGAALAVIVALYAALTYGQGVIHSDSSATNRILYSMRESGGFYPKTWNFYNYELYAFTIQNIGAYVQFFIGDAIIARVVASALILIFAVFSIIWFSKKILEDESYLVSLPIMFVFMSDVNYRDMFLYQADYVIQVIVITLCYGMAYKIIKQNDKTIRYMTIHSFLLFLLMIGGLRYAAEYVLPFSFMLGVNGIFALIKKEKKTVLDYIKNYILFFVVPTGIGYTLYKYICYSRASHVLGNQVGSVNLDFSLKTIMHNTSYTFHNLFEVFGYTNDGALIKNVIAILIAVLIFVVLPVIQLIDIKKLSKEELDYTLFAVFHNIIMLSVIILGSKTYERYLFTSIFAAALISANCVSRRLLSKDDWKIYTVTGVILLLTVFYCVDLYASTGNWRYLVEKQKEQCQMLIDKGVTKVYASYWLAYPHETYSNNKIKAGALDLQPRSLQKNYILTDDGSFKPIKGKSAIVMTQKEADEFSNAMHVTVGQQDEDFIIKDAVVSNNENYFTSDLVVFVYNEDIGDRLTDGFRDGLITIKDMDFNWYGTMTDKAYVLGENGMVHGPYSFLEKGHYELKIEGKNLVGCNCAVISDLAQDCISFTVTDIQEDYIKMDLHLSGGIEDLQVYLSNPMPDKTAEFYDIRVKKIEKKKEKK